MKKNEKRKGEKKGGDEEGHEMGEGAADSNQEATHHTQPYITYYVVSLTNHVYWTGSKSDRHAHQGLDRPEHGMGLGVDDAVSPTHKSKSKGAYHRDGVCITVLWCNRVQQTQMLGCKLPSILFRQR
jgi:hypothetical protein